MPKMLQMIELIGERLLPSVLCTEPNDDDIILLNLVPFFQVRFAIFSFPRDWPSPNLYSFSNANLLGAPI